MRIAVCDDDDIILSRSRELIQDYCTKNQIKCSISLFPNANELLWDIDDYGIYDILYLDIEICNINGIDVARSIRRCYPECIIIFISSHSRYYHAAFDVQPFYFLDKPLIEKEFVNVFKRAVERLSRYPQSITFSNKRIYYSVDISRILYFESDRRIVKVVCSDRTYNFYGKLSNIEKELGSSSYFFFRIHRSYLINIHYIKEFSRTYLIMANGIRVSVSQDKRQEIRSLYMKLIIDKC